MQPSFQQENLYAVLMISSCGPYVRRSLLSPSLVEKRNLAFLGIGEAGVNLHPGLELRSMPWISMGCLSRFTTDQGWFATVDLRPLEGRPLSSHLPRRWTPRRANSGQFPPGQKSEFCRRLRGAVQTMVVIGPIEDSLRMPHELHVVSASKPDFDLEAIKVRHQHRFIPGTGSSQVSPLPPSICNRIAA